jgi:hypothetical protein
MTFNDETEKHLVQAMVAVDRAQESAPLTVSGMLDDVADDLEYALGVYREKHQDQADDAE